jgi:hypothetical protein
MVFLSEDDTEELSKLAAKGAVKYIREHPNATDDIIADMIQGTLDGFILRKQRELNDKELEMEDN